MLYHRPNIKFRYCAALYLRQWLMLDQPLHMKVRKKSYQPDILQQIVSEYKAARSVRVIDHTDKKIKLSNAKRYQPFCDALNLYNGVAIRTRDDAVDIVETLQHDLFQSYKISALSAVTKSLWMRHQSPLVIYDSRACTALYHFGCDFDWGWYSEYCDEWEGVYAKHERDIVAACRWLSGSAFWKSLVRNNVRKEDELQALTASLWFRERVFDLWLYSEGGEEWPTNAEVALLIAE